MINQYNSTLMSAFCVFRYDDFYFLTEPSEFINSHFPDDQTWQLLTTPISIQEFEMRPLKTSAFYQLGLTLIQPKQYKTITGVHAHKTYTVNINMLMQNKILHKLKREISEANTMSVTP